ncbi:MAG: cytochrome c oxidase assembly protein [Pseudomonadota bacterium]
MTNTSSQNRRHGIVALSCVAFVCVMVGAAYAAVPLYDWFCRVTGFGGTPSVASVEVVPGLEMRDREITIRFDTNVAPGLPWKFRPKERTMTVRIGEVAQAMYVIENVSSERTIGTAAFNVTPFQGGGYFTKIECFCFQAQPLEAGETREIPVVFFVDPEFDDDRDADGITQITLSYTYFEMKGAQEPAPAG